MSRSYKMTKLPWNDPDVYAVVGPYAMDPETIRRLGNPITTNERTTWYFLHKRDKLKALCAVERTNVSLYIKNFIQVDGGNDLFFEFAKEISQEFMELKIGKLYCYVPTSILDEALKHGFKRTTPGKDWHRLVKEK